MYLTPLKTLIVRALRETFDSEYVNTDFRTVRIGIEYPIEPQFYPGIWVDYDDTQKLTRAGIDHKEQALTGDLFALSTRWKFAGTVAMTCVALSSLERDRLYDEVVRVVAFGAENASTAQFRTIIETNSLIAANMDFDTIEPRGNASAPGTPWGTDEIIYERTLNFDIIGEFVSDPVTGVLVALSAIHVTQTEVLGLEEQEDPEVLPGEQDWV